jgi:hypothetical protein
MTHIQPFGVMRPSNATTSAQLAGAAKGNIGSAGGYTGPINFAHQVNRRNNVNMETKPVFDYQPVDVEPSDDKYSKAKVKNSLKNEVKPEGRKAEDDLFGTTKRRAKKLKAQLSGIKKFIDNQKDDKGSIKKGPSKIKKFSDFK